MAAKSQTMEGLIVGTGPYMSPEQIRCEPVDPRADIFALGVVLYEALTGRLPFEGKTIADVFSSILRQTPPPVVELKPDSPRHLGRILRRCLEKEQRRRYQSAVDLKKISSLRVLSREKVTKATGGNAAVRAGDKQLVEVGARLGIDLVVGGAFQTLGNAVRITASFVDPREGEVVGSVKVDGTLDDIFSLQDRIVTGLTEALQLDVSDTDRHKIERLPTPGLEAYECYARGRQLVSRMDATSIDQAREFFEKAIELDSEYALAYSGLGQLYSMRFITTTDPGDLEKAVSNLQRAISLDPELGDPHTWLAYGYARQNRFAEAIEAGRRAVELEPDNPTSHYFLAVAYWLEALLDHRPEQCPVAARHLKATTRLAPNYQPGFMILGALYLEFGEYEDARGCLLRAAEIEESGEYELARFVGAFTLLGDLYSRLGELERARQYYARSTELLEGVDHVYASACAAGALCGRGETAFRMGRYEEAVSAFRCACDLALDNRRALGIGWLLLRARMGLAKSLYRSGKKKEAESNIAETMELSESREGFDFSGIWYSGDAAFHYEVAAYWAVRGRDDAALRHLRQSVDSGWSDARLLESDEQFSALRDRDEFQEIENAVRNRTPLPA
ncbi:MAG: tetratricopeptide repeat protein [Acidobacteriota bacterium]